MTAEFVTEFELWLELDSPEVRGGLIHEGTESIPQSTTNPDDETSDAEMDGDLLDVRPSGTGERRASQPLPMPIRDVTTDTGESSQPMGPAPAPPPPPPLPAPALDSFPALSHGIFDRYDLVPTSFPHDGSSEVGYGLTHSAFSDPDMPTTSSFRSFTHHSNYAGDLILGTRSHQPRQSTFGYTMERQGQAQDLDLAANFSTNANLPPINATTPQNQGRTIDPMLTQQVPAPPQVSQSPPLPR